MQKALAQSNTDSGDLYNQLYELRAAFLELDATANGNRSKKEVGANEDLTVGDRLGVAQTGNWSSTYGPTQLHLENFMIAQEQYEIIKADLNSLVNEKIPSMEKALEEAGAPWIEGQALPE